jgi:hypothetical protein
MGSLLSVRVNSLFPSLEVLARLGVNEEDIEDIRTYPEFAEELAELIVERRKKIEMAVGRDEALARHAIKELSDPKLLIWIAKYARLDPAAEAAMLKISYHELSEIARKHDDLDRVKIAARILPLRNLRILLSDKYVKDKRREILQGELAAGNY